jgi:hypothetical protein
VIREIKFVVATQLALRGYFQHDRGEWRRRHGFVPNENTILRRPRSADIADVDDGILDQVGPAASAAITRWLELLASRNPAAVATIGSQLGKWRQELLADGESAIEELCAVRATLCRVEIEVIAACVRATPTMTHAHAAALAERIKAAYRRLAAAVRTLNNLRAIASQEAE